MVDDIVRTLNAGEMPAKHIADVALQLKFGSGILMPLVAALEEAEWTFRRLREGKASPCFARRTPDDKDLNGSISSASDLCYDAGLVARSY